jgi:4-hydroxybenzoate polyprenyltransferase
MTRPWRAYLELLRLPAVFTAVADVMMGYLVTQGSLQPPWAIGLLIVTSAFLYLAGMVLNDVHDADVDAAERPSRPIPSGRIPLASARRLGWSLFAGGVAAGWLVGYLGNNLRSGVVATLLASSIVLYDIVLKSTPQAPIVMGTCRLLNVLLGMSLAETTDTMLPRPWSAAEWSIASGIGVYVAGITVFARTEARDSARRQLIAGIAIMLTGVAIVLRAASYAGAGDAGILGLKPTSWPLVWCVMTLMLALPFAFAIMRRSPDAVQFAVRRALRMLIILDLAAASVRSPDVFVLVFLSLLVLMIVLDRRFSTT